MKYNFFNRTIFTTQPTDHSYKHDQTWVGGVLPKLGQYKNTLLGKKVITKNDDSFKSALINVKSSMFCKLENLVMIFVSM